MGLGFAAGMALTPRPHESFRQKYARLARKVGGDGLEEAPPLKQKVGARRAEKAAERAERAHSSIRSLLSDFSYLGLAKIVLRLVSRGAGIAMKLSQKKAAAVADGYPAP